MRPIATFVALAMAALMTLSAPALAQEQSAPPPAAEPSASPAAAPAAVNPGGPIPYSRLRRPQRRAVAEPVATPPTPDRLAAMTPTVPLAVPSPTAPRATGARLAPGEALPPAELEAFVDGVVKDAMAREHIAGVTVAVVQNGQVVLKKGYGFASLKPERRVDPDKTLFRIGSISKTFTWIALMKEVEAGRIRIDAPINLYLPEPLQVKDQGYRTPVRVINLLDHSAGFEDRALGHLFEQRAERERPLNEYLRQERPRRVRAPGVVSTYSNFGSGLAGEAVSYVTGKTFEHVVEDEITGPLGMVRTTFREPHGQQRGLPAPMAAELARDVSTAYRWTPGGYRPRSFEFVGHLAPAGSASTTAADMSRYMLMLLNGGSLDGVAIYGPRTARAFASPIRATPAGINGWRHGFQEVMLPTGHEAFGHDGATLSFFSRLLVAPDLNLGVFISTNTDTGASLATRLPGRIVEQFYAAPRPFPRAGSPDLAARRQIYEGYYVTTRRAYGGLERFVDLLVGGVAVDVTADGHLTTTARDGVGTWAPDGPADGGRFISVSGDDWRVFHLEEGRAISFRASNGFARFERKGFWMRPRTLAILAGLTGLAAVSALGGVFLRNRREFRQTSIQIRASLIQNTQAVLWLLCLALFGLWASKTSDVARVMYGWPGASLVIASACALVAAALTVASLVILPAIWRGGRRVDSWTGLRKAGFTLTVMIYLAFSTVLLLWGGLSLNAG